MTSTFMEKKCASDTNTDEKYNPDLESGHESTANEPAKQIPVTSGSQQAKSGSTGDENKTFNPSDKFWGIYVEEAGKVDRELVEEWTEIADSILIFSGLFSAVITSLLIESYSNLQPDNEDRLADIMTTISAQLAASNGGGGSVVPAYTPPDPSLFRPQSISVWINGLWLLSLTFSLITAVFATLLREWARAYRQSITHHQVPHKRGTIRAYLFAGLEKWAMSEVIDLVPALIHITLILFLAGLALFMWHLHQGLAIMVLVISGGSTVLYLLFSIGTLVIYDFPYQTPLSQWMLRATSYLLSLFDKNWSLMTKVSKLRQRVALKDPRALTQAFKFVITTSNEEKEVEKLAESLPGLLSDCNHISESEGETAHARVARLFIAFEAPMVARILDGISVSDDGPEEHGRLANLLHAIAAALGHMEPDNILGSHGLNETWFKRCLGYFSHPSAEVARLAMTIYAHLTNAEAFPRRPPLVLNTVLTTKVLNLLRNYRPPPLSPVGGPISGPSWNMIVDCFDRPDTDTAGIVRSIWPEIYTSLASTGVSTTPNNVMTLTSPNSQVASPTSPLNRTKSSFPSEAAIQMGIPVAFVAAAKSLLARHASITASRSFTDLGVDIHTFVRACFALKGQKGVDDTLAEVLQLCSSTCGECEKLYREYEELKVYPSTHDVSHECRRTS